MEISSHLMNRLSRTGWAIHPDKLNTIVSVLNSKFVKGVNVTQMEGFAASVNSTERKIDPVKGYETIGNKAIIPVHGTLMNRCGWMDAMSGFTSMGSIEKAVKTASDDYSINHIILDFDTPGGTIAGVETLGNVIYGAREVKRITGFVNTEACSCGMWLASACDDVYASASLDIVGCIGVYAVHADQSARDEAMGIKYTYIKAGRYKVAGNPHEPLSEDAHNMLQGMIDLQYKGFVETVARNKGVGADEVLEKWADAQIFTAAQAVDNGLIDGIISFDDLIND